MDLISGTYFGYGTNEEEKFPSPIQRISVFLHITKNRGTTNYAIRAGWLAKRQHDLVLTDDGYNYWKETVI